MVTSTLPSPSKMLNVGTKAAGAYIRYKHPVVTTAVSAINRPSIANTISSPSKMYDVGKSAVGAYLKIQSPTAATAVAIINRPNGISWGYNKAVWARDQITFNPGWKNEPFYTEKKIAWSKNWHYDSYNPKTQTAMVSGVTYTKEEWDAQWASKEAFYRQSTLTRGEENAQFWNALIFSPNGAFGAVDCAVGYVSVGIINTVRAVKLYRVGKAAPYITRYTDDVVKWADDAIGVSLVRNKIAPYTSWAAKKGKSALEWGKNGVSSYVPKIKMPGWNSFSRAESGNVSLTSRFIECGNNALRRIHNPFKLKNVKSASYADDVARLQQGYKSARTWVDRGKGRMTTGYRTTSSISVKKWLASSIIRYAQYEVALYGFRESGLEDALVPQAYRPAVDTALNYVVPFFIVPGGGTASQTTTAFFSKQGLRKFIGEGINQAKNLTNPTLIKSTFRSVPSSLTFGTVKRGVTNGIHTYKKEIAAGYAKLGSEGKAWIPIQIARQGIHVGRDLAVFNAGIAGTSLLLNKAGVKTIPYVNINTLEAENIPSALNITSEYAAAGAISGLVFGFGDGGNGPCYRACYITNAGIGKLYAVV